LGAVQVAGLGIGESAEEVAAAVLLALRTGGNAPALREFVDAQFGWEPQLAHFLQLVEGP